jgi:hypothetical protein
VRHNGCSVFAEGVRISFSCFSYVVPSLLLSFRLFFLFMPLVLCLPSHSFVASPTMRFPSALSAFRDMKNVTLTESALSSLSCPCSGRADSNINWNGNSSPGLHLPHLLMPTFDLVVVGCGGGPYETNLSSYVSTFFPLTKGRTFPPPTTF